MDDPLRIKQTQTGFMVHETRLKDNRFRNETETHSFDTDTDTGTQGCARFDTDTDTRPSGIAIPDRFR